MTNALPDFFNCREGIFDMPEACGIKLAGICRPGHENIFAIFFGK